MNFSLPTDRLKDGMTRFVEGVFPQFDFFARYPARVVVQNGQALDVQPDDQRIPGLSGLQMKLGLPGVQVTVQPGARVLVGFDEGNPAAPFVELWEANGVVIEFDLAASLFKFNSGIFPVARAAGGDSAGPYPIATPGSVAFLVP
jgi:hypothetical protein